MDLLDSDWAGEVRNGRTTTRPLEAFRNASEQHIGLSSAEAEHNTLVHSACIGLGVKIMICRLESHVGSTMGAKMITKIIPSECSPGKPGTKFFSELVIGN